MRGMKDTMKTMIRRMSRMVMHGRHEMMIRRAANRIAHVITPHGKIQSGRKGRKG